MYTIATQKCWYVLPQKLLWPSCFVNSSCGLVWPLYTNICTVISSIHILLNGKLIQSTVTICNSTNSQHHLKIQQFSTHFFTCKAVNICANEDSPQPQFHLTGWGHISEQNFVLVSRCYTFQYHLSFQGWKMSFKFIVLRNWFYCFTNTTMIRQALKLCLICKKFTSKSIADFHRILSF